MRESLTIAAIGQLEIIAAGKGLCFFNDRVMYAGHVRLAETVGENLRVVIPSYSLSNLDSLWRRHYDRAIELAIPLVTPLELFSPSHTFSFVPWPDQGVFHAVLYPRQHEFYIHNLIRTSRRKRIYQP